MAKSKDRNPFTTFLYRRREVMLSLHAISSLFQSHCCKRPQSSTTSDDRVDAPSSHFLSSQLVPDHDCHCRPSLHNPWKNCIQWLAPWNTTYDGCWTYIGPFDSPKTATLCLSNLSSTNLQASILTLPKESGDLTQFLRINGRPPTDSSIYNRTGDSQRVCACLVIPALGDITTESGSILS